MGSYNVELELEERDNAEEHADKIIGIYDGMSPAVSLSPRGWLDVVVTVNATSIKQAVDIATGLAPHPVVSVNAMSEREFDRRIKSSETDQIPPLLSPTDAANRLGMTRQAVDQKIKAGLIPAIRVGRAWVIPASVIPEKVTEESETA